MRARFISGTIANKRDWLNLIISKEAKKNSTLYLTFLQHLIVVYSEL